jgi:hypothetical protein
LFWSLCYFVLRRLLQLAALRFRSDEFKELEIVVLVTSSRCCIASSLGPS